MSAVAVVGAGRRLRTEDWKGLVEGTLRNVKQLDAARALSGPIARGDIETVRAQLEALRPFPAAALVYRVLAKEAVELAERGGLSGGKVRALKRMLGRTRPLPRGRRRTPP